ncbi:MAG: hypothetical protein NDP13_00475 [Crenarchaeota archaeon]|nr:hypothetical protein [Thermoproteota archaeon]
MRRFVKLSTTMILICLILAIPTISMLTLATPPDIVVHIRSPDSTPDYAPAIILPQNQTEIWLNRTVRISEFLFIRVIDEFNISNTKDRPFTAIVVYYPVKFWEDMISITVLGAYRNDSFRPLEYALYYRSKEYVGVLIKFYTLLDKYSLILQNTFKVRVIFELREGLFEIKPYGTKLGIYLNMTPTPFVPYPIKSLVVSFISPEDTTLEFDYVKPTSGKTLFGGNNFRYSKENLPPMDPSLNLTKQLSRYGFESEVCALWSTTKAIPVVRHANRSVFVTRSYQVYIVDNLVISCYSLEAPAENPEESKWKLSSIRVGLAANVSQIIEVKDNTRKLSYAKDLDKDLPESIYVLRVDFPTPIVAGESRNIYIKYLIKLDKKFISGDKFNLKLPIAPLLNTSLYTLRLSIKTSAPTIINLPKGYIARYYSSGMENLFISQFKQVVLAFERLNPKDIDYALLTIDYDWKIFLNSYFVLLIYVLIASIAIVEISCSIHRLARKPVKPKEVKKIADLEKFIMNYETIIATDKDLWAAAYENLLLRRPVMTFISDYSKKIIKLGEKIDLMFITMKGLKSIAELYDYLIELEKVEERLSIYKQRLIESAERYTRGELPDAVYTTRVEAILLNLKDDLNRREMLIAKIRDWYLSLTT